MGNLIFTVRCQLPDMNGKSPYQEENLNDVNEYNSWHNRDGKYC